MSQILAKPTIMWTQLEAGDVEGQALGGQDYTAVAVIPWWIPAAAGLGLIGYNCCCYVVVVMMIMIVCHHL
ncbi:hypothetical protein M0N77_13080 [Psychrobacter sp. AH5]|uniref:hypothetical protein n=1 Tax=Psychrobacter sp. AH5 TaxID=2937433 RepID=UPI00334243CF